MHLLIDVMHSSMYRSVEPRACKFYRQRELELEGMYEECMTAWKHEWVQLKLFRDDSLKCSQNINFFPFGFLGVAIWALFLLAVWLAPQIIGLYVTLPVGSFSPNLCGCAYLLLFVWPFLFSISLLWVFIFFALFHVSL